MLTIENVIFIFVLLRASASHMFCRFRYAIFSTLLCPDRIQVGS